MKRDTLLLLIIAGVLILGGGVALVTGITRGIRNNNPGNIRKSTTAWAGQVPPEAQTDDDFVQFIAPEYGIRAMAKILQSYANRGLDTVTEIIGAWAPPNENDTAAYIASVSTRTGLPPNQKLTSTQWPALIAAIIQHENGSQPYTAQVLQHGVSLA